MECLLVLLEAGRVHVGQVVGEDLELAFLSDGSGKNRIDGSVHSVSFLSNTCPQLGLAIDMPPHAIELILEWTLEQPDGPNGNQRKVGTLITRSVCRRR
jgi:hypothetical protein